MLQGSLVEGRKGISQSYRGIEKSPSTSPVLVGYTPHRDHRGEQISLLIARTHLLSPLHNLAWKVFKGRTEDGSFRGMPFVRREWIQFPGLAGILAFSVALLFCLG
jgi:hypothetical protein